MTRTLEYRGRPYYEPNSQSEYEIIRMDQKFKIQIRKFELVPHVTCGK